jgi:hypothetical protein
MDKIEELETNISRTIMVISVFNSEIKHLRFNTPKPKILLRLWRCGGRAGAPTLPFSFCSPTDKEGRIRELETPSTKDGLERECRRASATSTAPEAQTWVSLETSKYYAKLRLEEMRLEYKNLVDLKKINNLPVN